MSTQHGTPAALTAEIERLQAEQADLRRQVVTLHAELDQARQERDRARRALHLRDLEDTGLYDAFGQPLK